MHLCDLGWSLIDAGCLDEAEEPLRKANTLAPGKTMAEGNLGISQTSLNDLEFDEGASKFSSSKFAGL